MFLNSGFSFNNLKGEYIIKDHCPAFNEKGEEQYYIRVCQSAFESGRQIILKYDTGLSLIETSTDYPEKSIALKFVSINIKKEKEILDFCNEYGLLYINLQDNEPNNNYIVVDAEPNMPKMLNSENSHYCMPVDEFVYQVLRMRRVLLLNEAMKASDNKRIIEILSWFTFNNAFIYDEDGDAKISEYECPRFHDYYSDYILQEHYEGRNHDDEMPSETIRSFLSLISEYGHKDGDWIDDNDIWDMSSFRYDMKLFSWRYMHRMFSRLIERVDILKVDPVGDIIFSRELTDEDVKYICPDQYLLNQFVKAFISDHFNSVLHNVRPQMVVQNGQLLPNLRISSLLEAMYVDLFFRFTPYTKFRKCANPTCNAVFEVSRENSKKIYCGVGCAQLMAKRMQREREKARNQ